MYPKRGVNYRYEQLQLLDLGDSPALNIPGVGVIQDSHLTVDEMLTVPEFKDTEWKYIRTTDEWIPIFEAVDSEAVLKCVDVTDCIGAFDNPGDKWITPKGFPREQYTGQI